MALGGVFVKLIAPRISDTFWSMVYIGFGWLAVLALKPMIETVAPLANGASWFEKLSAKDGGKYMKVILTP